MYHLQSNLSNGNTEENNLYNNILFTRNIHRMAPISTADLKARLAKHNAGEVPHTSKFKPWKVEAYFAFETKEKATAFEAYLKTGSGHAFAKRHF